MFSENHNNLNTRLQEGDDHRRFRTQRIVANVSVANKLEGSRKAILDQHKKEELRKHEMDLLKWSQSKDPGQSDKEKFRLM